MNAKLVSPVGILAVLAVSLLAPSSDRSATVETPLRIASVATTTRPLPAVVEGVPLLSLAGRALGAAEAYGVSRPENVGVVISTEADVAEQLMPSVTGLPEGADDLAYFISLDGRFSCGSCGTSTASPGSIPTTTINPLAVPVSTMILEVPISTGGGTIGEEVGIGTPDLYLLGTVHDLDPYIASLAGVSVPTGPVPG